ARHCSAFSSARQAQANWLRRRRTAAVRGGRGPLQEDWPGAEESRPGLHRCHDCHARGQSDQLRRGHSQASQRAAQVGLEPDRGTPGTGQIRWDETFKALKQINYDGWLMIEAFGRALPDLAAATRIWRDLFPSPEDVYTNGLKFMKKMWSK